MRATLLCAVLLICCVGATGADAASAQHPELTFGTGLVERGYRSLAAEHLGRVRRMDFLPEGVRTEAMLRLARLCRELGNDAAAEGDNQGKLDYYQRAVKQYEDYLERVGSSIERERRSILKLERSDLCQRLGRHQLLGFELTVEPEEKVEYQREARHWLSTADESLAEAAEYLVERRDALRDQARTDAEKGHYREVRELTARALLRLGQSRYFLAKTFVESAEDEKRDQKLQEAMEPLTKLAEEYEMFNVRYTARRYLGLCYKDLGKYEEALAEFDKALQAHRLPATEWILRRARLNMAETYREAGQPEKAMVTAEVLLADLRYWLSVQRDPRTIDMLFAAEIEHAEGLVDRAKELVKKGKREEAVSDYQQAVNKVSEIAANTRTKWSRNAKALLDLWVEQSGQILPRPIQVEPNVHTYLARGWRLWDEQRYAESIRAFRNAVESADPELYAATLLPEAWYKIGEAYYRLSGQQYTGGKYNYYYEAGTCFEHVARAYPEAENHLAAHAARMAKDFYGALFKQTRKMGRELAYDGRRYRRSLEWFSSRFPEHPDAARALFQSAELARTLEEYREAARIYAGVKKDHGGFYEARYRAGLCLYLEALRLYEAEQPDAETIGEVLQEAAQRYEDYVGWFADNSAYLSAKELEVANLWVAKARLGLGRMLVHEVWGHGRDREEGARRALEMMAGFREDHLEGVGRDEMQDEMLPHAFMVQIQAYRRLGELKSAEKFVDAIVERYSRHRLSSQAASLLGYAYLQRRRELTEEGGDQALAEAASQKAGQYLQKAVELNPAQDLAAYLEIAGQLYVGENFEQGLKILRTGLERNPIEGGQPTRDQLRVMEAMATGYREMEEWEKLRAQAEKLTAVQPRNVDYWMDVALALEKQEKWPEAIEAWRAAKSRAGTARDAEFRSTIHLARCYARSGQGDHGFRVAGWFLMSDSKWMSDPQESSQVLELFEESFDDRFAKLGSFAIQLVQEDINLLRKPESRRFVNDLITEHCSEFSDELRKLQRQARVELRTG